MPAPDPGHRLKSLSLRQLRCFVEVARRGGFTAAARELAVSQPALSAMVRQIERQFGLELFHRTTHKVTLSDYGRAVLPLAERLLIAADNAFEDMRTALRHERLAIRIGAIPSALPMIAEAIAKVEAAQADLEVHLSDGRNDELVDGLRRGCFDFIVGIGPVPSDEFEMRTIMEDDMLLLAPAAHPLAQTDSQPWRALGGYDVVHFSGGSIGTLVAAALTAHGLKAADRFRLEQVESLYAVVGKGLSLAILPRLYARASRTHPGIRSITLVEPTVTRRIALIYRRQLAREHPRASIVAESMYRLAKGADPVLERVDRNCVE